MKILKIVLALVLAACSNGHETVGVAVPVLQESCETYEFGSAEPVARNPIPLCDNPDGSDDMSSGLWFADEVFQDLTRVPASFEYWVGEGTFFAPCCFDLQKGRPDCDIEIGKGENAELIGLRDERPTYTPHPRVF
jgi:hypothetical protein